MWEREGVIGEITMKSMTTVTVDTMEEGVLTDTIEMNNPNASLVSTQKISFEFDSCYLSLPFLKTTGLLL